MLSHSEVQRGPFEVVEPDGIDPRVDLKRQMTAVGGKPGSFKRSWLLDERLDATVAIHPRSTRRFGRLLEPGA